MSSSNTHTCCIRTAIFILRVQRCVRFQCERECHYNTSCTTCHHGAWLNPCNVMKVPHAPCFSVRELSSANTLNQGLLMMHINASRLDVCFHPYFASCEAPIELHLLISPLKSYTHTHTHTPIAWLPAACDHASCLDQFATFMTKSPL